MKIDEGLKKQIKKKIFEQLEDNKNTQLIIMTPHPLTESQKEKLMSYFPEYRNLKIENLIDRNLLGGFVIKSGSSIIDASIKGRITNLVNKLYGLN